MLKLVKPSKKYLLAFMRVYDDYKQDTNKFKGVQVGALIKAIEENRADEYIKSLRDAERGIGLPDGYVPSTSYWLMDDDNWVGAFAIRHSLTPKLEQEGGHIAGNIAPKYRGKYSSFVGAKMCLDRARKLGLKRVLITCDAANSASYRAITGLMKIYGGEQLPDSFVKGHDEHRIWVNTTRGSLSNKQILENFYASRNKTDAITENDVLLERFITNTYLQKYVNSKSLVAEIGAGIRSYSPDLMKYAKNVVAIDLFEKNLNNLSKKIKNKNFYTFCADATNLESVKDNCFDVVFVNGPLSHLFDRESRTKAIAEATRICKRGGVVMFNYLTNTPIIYRAGLIKGDLNAFKKYNEREPRDIYATYFVNDFHTLVPKSKLKLIKDISLDGLFEILKEYTNKLSKSELNTIKQMQLQICERADMIGCASHVISIYNKV